MNRRQRRANEALLQKRKLELYDSRDCGQCRVCCTLMQVAGVPVSEHFLEHEANRPDTQDRRDMFERGRAATKDGKAVEYFWNKPEGVPCPHVQPEPEKGCGIYGRRPVVCREWACEWRGGGDLLSPDERPDRTGYMIETVMRRELPWSFFKATHKSLRLLPDGTKTIDQEAAVRDAEGFLDRLASTQLIVVVQPEGWRLMGPTDRVQTYEEVVALVAERMKANAPQP